MKTGNGEVKTGSKGRMPSPLHTVALAVRALFFNEKALYALFLNKDHTLNIACFYFISLFIPYREINGSIYPEGAGNLIENVVLTSVFITILFLYLPKRMAVFTGFLRLMLAFEATSLFLPLSFLLSPEYVKIFIPVIMSWYLSLTVFAVAKIKGFPYWVSTLIVFGSFFITIFTPLFFE